MAKSNFRYLPNRKNVPAYWCKMNKEEINNNLFFYLDNWGKESPRVNNDDNTELICLFCYFIMVQESNLSKTFRYTIVLDE